VYDTAPGDLPEQPRMMLHASIRVVAEHQAYDAFGDSQYCSLRRRIHGRDPALGCGIGGQQSGNRDQGQLGEDFLLDTQHQWR
jgi:hypothetical protein